MLKTIHEIRDPIHGFVHVDDHERMIVDSPPLQRLRQIHQLAMSYLVYPGATHRRFEHSLGVMELADRVFAIVTDREHVHPDIRELMPEIHRDDDLRYWRRALRMAGLCHDVGHLPFSHAAEKDLLPEGWSHERLTVELIRSPEMERLWQQMTPPLRSMDVAKLAVGQKVLKGEVFTDWEAVLSEIIVGEAFGVDRMDYLLRDSLHAGVAYGRFDHFRLIDTIRILPSSRGPELGVEEGGLHSAAALLLARYFMFSQVYYHHVRLIYDIHLKDYLREWLSERRFPIRPQRHLNTTDIDITSAMVKAARRRTARGHETARRILRREHFKVLWASNPADLSINPEAGSAICTAAGDKFGEAAIRRHSFAEAGAVIDFPVLQRDGRIESAYVLSDVINKLPPIAFDYIFVRPDLQPEAEQWLREVRQEILQAAPEEE